VVAPGYKYNLTDPAAAMGLVQLRRAESMRRRRAEIATRYSEAFAALGLDLPASPTGGIEHSWHLYVIRVPGGVNRDRVIDDLAKAGIGTSVHFIPLHLQPYWRDRAGHTPEAFPMATREYHRVISLPIYSSMTNEQVDRVIAALTELSC
jgi:dTDP-4-amino-4,6-dideoxygalactose transaminase